MEQYHSISSRFQSSNNLTNSRTNITHGCHLHDVIGSYLHENYIKSLILIYGIHERQKTRNLESIHGDIGDVSSGIENSQPPRSRSLWSLCSGAISGTVTQHQYSHRGSRDFPLKWKSIFYEILRFENQKNSSRNIKTQRNHKNSHYDREEFHNERSLDLHQKCCDKNTYHAPNKCF